MTDINKPEIKEPILVKQGIFFSLYDHVGEVTDRYDMFNIDGNPTSYIIRSNHQSMIATPMGDVIKEPLDYVVELTDCPDSATRQGWDAMWFLTSCKTPWLNEEGVGKAQDEFRELLLLAVRLTPEKWKQVQALLDKRNEGLKEGSN